MSLNWNEIKSRKLLFSKATPFWIAFFEIFGITNKRVATFELNVKKLGGAQGFVDLYDPLTMPLALLKAHQKLDAAVDTAYQPSGDKKSYASDAERVAFLFDLYQRITSLLPVPAAKKTRKTKATESY